MNDKAAGERLRKLLERARIEGETMEELAGRLGVTRTALNAWLAGREPSMASCRAIAEVCGVPRFEVVKVYDGD